MDWLTPKGEKDVEGNEKLVGLFEVLADWAPLLILALFRWLLLASLFFKTKILDCFTGLEECEESEKKGLEESLLVGNLETPSKDDPE